MTRIQKFKTKWRLFVVDAVHGDDCAECGRLVLCACVAVELLVPDAARRHLEALVAVLGDQHVDDQLVAAEAHRLHGLLHCRREAGDQPGCLGRIIALDSVQRRGQDVLCVEEAERGGREGVIANSRFGLVLRPPPRS